MIKQKRQVIVEYESEEPTKRSKRREMTMSPRGPGQESQEKKWT